MKPQWTDKKIEGELMQTILDTPEDESVEVLLVQAAKRLAQRIRDEYEQYIIELENQVRQN